MLGRFDEGVRFMTITTRQARWGLLVMVFVLVFRIGSFAQSRSAAVSPSPSPAARDLNTILAELMRASPATSQDLTDLQQPGGKLHRITFWRGDNVQKDKMTAALRRNLQFAVPDLIHDAQASGGSISTTFKLYKDLTVVCESLDSLLPTGSREGKTELTALRNDISDMNRLREELSSYIQQTAASMESKNAQLVSSAGRSPKKVIVDDTIPEKPSPTKHRPSNQ
jgi:hypothetical protein